MVLWGEHGKGKVPLSQSSGQLTCGAQNPKVFAAAGEQRRDRVVGVAVREATGTLYCRLWEALHSIWLFLWETLQGFEQGSAWSNLGLKTITQEAICQRACKWAMKEDETPGRTHLQ